VLRVRWASQFWKIVPPQAAEWFWYRRALRAFRFAYGRVDAYRKLLVGLGIDPRSVRRFDDFRRKVPLTDADSYVEVYGDLERWARRCWPVAYDLVSGAGSGEHLWPRSAEQVKILCEQLREVLGHWGIPGNRRTCVLVMLPEGGWPTRIGALRAFDRVAMQQRGRLSVLAVRGRRAAALEAYVHRLQDLYESFVIVVDAALAGRIWRRVEAVRARAGRIRAVVFGPPCERISVELWLEAGGRALFGIEAAGCLCGAETHFSRVLWRTSVEYKRLGEQLWGADRRPVGVFQCLPAGPFVEEVEGRLFVSASGCAPVVRYDSGYHGRVVPAEQACRLLESFGIVPLRAIRRQWRGDARFWRLPVFAVFGR